MENVGIRELKNKLSAYVRKAEAGDIVLVTDRGRVVAELLELARRDGLRLPTRPNDPELYRRPLPRVDLGAHSTKEMIDFLREDRE
jgi:prevent-host-death family protein